MEKTESEIGIENVKHVLQFIKGDEAASEISQKFKECMWLMNITQQNAQTNSLEDIYCPLIFDGWTCWNATPAGTIAVNECPSFVVGFDPGRTAFKECDSNGTWFVHPETHQPWSNYSTCIDFEDLQWRKMINWVYMSGYSMSLIALVMSILILTYFRALRCTRNLLHINLFASFSINNLLWLIWYVTVVPEPEVITENGIWCRIVFVLTHYFMLTNYFWMLCEGFYLHSLLAFAFIIEEQLLVYAYALGWVIPILVITIYAGFRIFNEDNNDCWIHNSVYSIILVMPVVISLLINLVFLISILRVLLLKIRTNSSQGPNNELIKVFRAAFVLVPLLGLHYIIVSFRPDNDEYWAKVHEFVSAVSASYQGLCVACLFCFLNNEVHCQIRRKWCQFWNITNNNQFFSTVTGSTYALERRATRLSNALPQHGNEISPALKRYSNISADENRQTNDGDVDLTITNIPENVIRDNESSSLMMEQNMMKNTAYKAHQVDSFNMKPLIRSSNIAREDDHLHMNTNLMEDYV